MNQREIIENFCKDSTNYTIGFSEDVQNIKEFLNSEKPLENIDLSKHEIYTSIDYKDGDKLFAYDLKPHTGEIKVDNPIQLLLNNLEGARIIELVYPGIFKWGFNGLSIKAYAIIPSGSAKENSTITRYGGTEKFIKILRQHLENIGKMNKGITPDYNFLQNTDRVEETELSIGSINNFNKMYSIGINTKLSYIDILKNSKVNKQTWSNITTLDMKYWAREINPDFINEAKHIKLKDTLSIETPYQDYPPCIKNLTGMKHKGNLNRYLLLRFLLTIHKPRDAKFIYYSVLSDNEREHVKTGNCSSQWTYVLNNIKKYDCPTCSEFKRFCNPKCPLVHPLENIQKKIEGEKKDEHE